MQGVEVLIRNTLFASYVRYEAYKLEMMSTMNNSRPQSEYRCSQSDLYTVCETIAGTYTDHSASFEAYSSLYTATTGTDLLAEIAAARLMPDESQRNATHAVLRKDLDNLRVNCLSLWQQLTSYIRDGFAPEVYDNMIDSAGHAYYESALGGNWDSVRSLMDSASSFITTEAADLTTGGMPAGFDASVTTAKDDFAAKHDAFLQSEEASRISTDKKIEANNNIYRQTIRICEDGKRIYRQEASVRLEFTFDRVLDLVRNSQTGHGVSGNTTDAATEDVLGQVELTLERLQDDGTYVEEGTLDSDNAGFYKFNGVVDGSYRMTVAKTGYVTLEQMVTVSAGPVVVDFALSSE